MNRRAFLLAGLFSTSALIPATSTSAWAQPALTVVYVGGWDCEPCLRWKKTCGWLASPEYKKVRWIEVESPKLKEAYQARYWPEELKPVLEKLPLKNGTPRFLVLRNGQIIDNRFGGNYWPVILGDIRKNVG